MFKVGTAFARKTLGGDNLLVTSRNVASKEVLESGADMEEAAKLGRELLELPPDKFKEVTGMDKSLLDNASFARINDPTRYETTSSEGVCFATCLHFAGRIVENFDNLSEKDLKALARILS